MDDHDRPLNARGRDAAPRMGVYIESRNYAPDLVLCSTAKRTRETLELMLPELSPKPKIKTTRTLYLADWTTILKTVHDTPRGTESVLVIGHNPGLERLAVALGLNPTGAAERVRAEHLIEKFPTAALAVFEWEGADWRALKPGQARLVDFVRPRDLGVEGE